MAIKRYFIGRQGPFNYDDESTYRTTDHAGDTKEAFVTEGQMRVGEPATDPEHVVPLGDLVITIQKIRNKAYFFSSF